jgi:hypothetical protein
MNKCLRCGHDWVSRVEKPDACPRCKSYAWNKAKGKSAPKDKPVEQETQKKKSHPLKNPKAPTESPTEAVGMSNSFSQDFADRIVKIREKFNTQESELGAVAFVTAHKMDSNHKAILSALDKFIRLGHGIDPKKVKHYLDGELLRVNGNCSEQEHTAKAAEDKVTREEKPIAQAPLPEVKKIKCSGCGKLVITAFIAGNQCFHCTPRSVFECPNCRRLVGRNLIDSEHGFCHHCKPGNQIDE